MPDELQTVSPDESDPRSSSTLIVGAVGIVLLVVVVILLEVLFYDTAETEYQRKVVAEQPQQLRLLQAEQRDRLNAYRWVDRENGVVALPIERAMELVVKESGAAADAATSEARP